MEEIKIMFVFYSLPSFFSVLCFIYYFVFFFSFLRYTLTSTCSVSLEASCNSFVPSFLLCGAVDDGVVGDEGDGFDCESLASHRALSISIVLYLESSDVMTRNPSHV